MGRLLGIDYGEVRIGLAITDERKMMALPACVIKASKTPQLTAESIAKEIARYGLIEKIIIGLPLLLNGKEGDMALKVKAFGAVLQDVFKVEVIYWDERLTSSQVDRLMMEAGLNRKKRAQHVDTMAAATILQNYMDAHRIN